MKKLLPQLPMLLFLLLPTLANAQWIQQKPYPTGKDLNSVYTDANTGYTVGIGGTILKITNAQVVWTQKEV